MTVKLIEAMTNRDDVQTMTRALKSNGHVVVYVQDNDVIRPIECTLYDDDRCYLHYSGTIVDFDSIEALATKVLNIMLPTTQKKPLHRYIA